MTLIFTVLLIVGTIPKLAPVTTSLFFGDKGPYLFLVDTGAESTSIDPKLAIELKIQPTFQIELVSLNGTRLVPATRLNTLRFPNTTIPEVDILIDDPIIARQINPSVRGILGADILSQLNFNLRPRSGRIEIATPRPIGPSIPFARSGNRILVQALMGQEILSLILDSGASQVVLFHTPAAMIKTKSMTTNMTTLDGARSTVPTTWTADLTFSNQLRLGMLPAAIVTRNIASRSSTQIDGLLPASAFSAIYVDQARKELVLVP